MWIDISNIFIAVLANFFAIVIPLVAYFLRTEKRLSRIETKLEDICEKLKCLRA